MKNGWYSKGATGQKAHHFYNRRKKSWHYQIFLDGTKRTRKKSLQLVEQRVERQTRKRSLRLVEQHAEHLTSKQKVQKKEGEEQDEPVFFISVAHYR